MKMESAQGAERLQKISKDLDQIVLDIEKNNRKIKELENSKESFRNQLFCLINEYIEVSEIVESQVLNVKCASRAEAELHVEENYPGWRIVQYENDQIVIEEDPSQMRFTWTTEDGYQINRTTAIVGTRFDYEKLKNHAPDLFKEVVEVKTVYELNEKKAQNFLEQNPEILPLLQESTKLGKVQLRLSSPKKVTEE